MKMMTRTKVRPCTFPKKSKIHMTKKTKTPPTTFSLWVVEVHIHTVVPNVELFTAVKVGPTGAKVIKYGSEVFIHKASHRHFFDDEQKMRQFVEKQMRHTLRRFENSAVAIREVLDDLDKKLPIKKVLAERPTWYDKAPILD